MVNKITRIDARRISVEVRFPDGPGHVLIERGDGGRIVITTGSADPVELDSATWLAVVAFTEEHG